MKHLKIIGLAAIAAMAFMAFAASASADVLCKTAPNKSGECETATGDYAANSAFESTSSNAKLTVTGGATAYITCSGSTVKMENTTTGSNTPGATIGGKVTSVSWTGCTTAAGFGCTVSSSSGYTGTIKATNDTGAGTMTVNGAIKTKVTCVGVFECEYEPTASGIDFSITGGNPATGTASEQPLTLIAGGFGCGSSAKWDATYTMTGTNKAVWVATKNA